MEDVRHSLKKLSEYIKSKCPDVDPIVAKNVIIAFREYMFDLRQGRHYCDVCYNLISQEEAEQTKNTDFNYCCAKHAEFKNHFQLDLVRKQIGLKVEDLPQIDIYG
jgi:hypothetical protein